MNAFLQKLAAQAKVEADDKPAPQAVDKTGFMTRTSAPAPIDFTAPPAQDDEADDGSTTTAEAVPNEIQKIRDELRAEFAKERAALQSSFHQAGNLDAETLRKAQQYDAMMADPVKRAVAIDAPLPELGDEAKAIDARLRTEPGYKDALQRLALEAMRSDPVFKSALEKQRELDAYLATQRKGAIDDEARELLAVVPREQITQTEAQQIEAMRLSPAFRGKTVVQLYEMVTGKKVSKRSTTPPPPSERAPVRKANTALAPTRDIYEAARRAIARQNQE